MTDISKRAVTTALAGLAMIAAVPASAANDPGAGKPKAAEKTSARDTSARRYCIATEPNTGTRIGRTICQTRADWLADGVDPLELMKKSR